MNKGGKILENWEFHEGPKIQLNAHLAPRRASARSPRTSRSTTASSERHRRPALLAGRRAAPRAARGRQAADPVPRPLRPPQRPCRRCSTRSSRCTRSTRASVRLCVVGDGPLGNVYRRKLPERVAGDVIWAGRVDWSRPRYYASADIHCTPCQRASFGMVLLEAMSDRAPGRRQPHLGLPAAHGARQAGADGERRPTTRTASPRRCCTCSTSNTSSST